MISASILLITGNRSVARDLHERLTKLGYKIIGVAGSEKDAIHMIRESKPDVIMTDIHLNKTRGGIKTGKLIQSTYNTPIIYITGSIGQATIQRAKSTGPFGFIFKPYDDKQLLVTIETALTRYELERKLRESRQWLNTTLTSIGEGVIATDEQDLVRFINPAATELTEWPHKAAIGKSIHEVLLLVDESSQKQIDIASLKEQAARKLKTTFEGLLFSKHGRSMPVEANAALIFGDKGEIYGMVLILRDITKQREALSEIQRQANHAEALVQVASQLNNQLELTKVLSTICVIINRTLEASATAVFLLDSRKTVFRDMAAYTDDPLLQTHENAHFEIPSELLEAMVTFENPIVVLQDVQAYPGLPYLDLLKGQDVKTLVIAALFSRDRLIGALMSVFTGEQHILPMDDMALLKGLADQAASAIENAELFDQVRMGRERQRKLAKSLVDVQEAERRHIAQELHDHLGQALTGLQFMLENAKGLTDGRQRSNLEEIQKSVGEIIEQVREMSLDLRPSMLDDMGLIPTLRWHFGRYTRQTGILVDFQCEESLSRFSTEIETAAYRIIQEALTNVARHANAREVYVGLTIHGGALWVEVVDKGKGFDTASITQKPTSGLGGMRERADLAGGFLTIRSYVGQGTQIVASLPLTDKPIERRKYGRPHSSGR